MSSCSPPRGSGDRRSPQVRGMGLGKGRAGKSGAPARLVVAARVQRLGPLGAQPPARGTVGGAGVASGQSRPWLRGPGECRQGSRAP
ncbi:hypothetical protein NDU88_006187 [Pleurodeles waltl]|uniref:Uncharacterized protein n=1 Tax=Pleurodeles waltl TaxID=8319 RepID=A0AAV7PKR3_PLEWA|nr:hypothetical protein NDU88_006187 [Pleurodeles waltl]